MTLTRPIPRPAWNSLLLPLVLLTGCGRTLPGPPPGQAGQQCQEGQVQVLLLGTFHFAQQNTVDILAGDRQAELAAILDRLEEFAPTAIAVEYPYAQNAELSALYREYLGAGEGSLSSRNEIDQIGFRLARRLGHGRVHGVDVRMPLWHDSIAIFDELYPDSRNELRRRWSHPGPVRPQPDADRSLSQMIRAWNAEDPPRMAEYGRFLPLVEGDIYAGALKLRPWYDRNMRIVQNFFRIIEDSDDRILLVIGGSHVPVLRHLLRETPQFCTVDPLAYLPQ